MTLSDNVSKLSFTVQEIWTNPFEDHYACQVDDGTTFYYSAEERRLYVKWERKEINARLKSGFGISELSAFYPLNNALFFVANRKVYRAFFVPPDAIAVSYVRNLLETEKPRRNGLCCRDRFVHRICDNPAIGGILVDISALEKGKMRFEGMHRGRTLYDQFSYETMYPSARKIGENAIAIQCNGTMYSYRDSSPFIYISCGKNLFTLDTTTMQFLPHLSFGLSTIIHSIVGVHNGVITAVGKHGNDKALMTAELPKGYFEWSDAYNGLLDAGLQRENRELRSTIEQQSDELQRMQSTMDKFQESALQLKLQIDEMTALTAPQSS